MVKTTNVCGKEKHTMWSAISGKWKSLVMIKDKPMQKLISVMVLCQPQNPNDDGWSWCKGSEIIYLFLGT